MRGSKAILRLSFTSALSIGLALAACGKTNSLADAPATDGNRTDAANTIDADAHGPVTVIVMNSDGASGPEMGVPVAFLEPDGTLAAEAMTDVSGKATADVLPGASVTAVYVESATQHSLETVNGVKPGDTITIGDVYDGTNDGTFTVNLIDVVGTQRYDVYGPCGSASFTPVVTGSGSSPWKRDGVIATDPVVLTMYKGCEESMMDLVAVRIVGDEPTDYIELDAVPWVPSGSTTQSAAWTPVGNLTMTLTDVSADVTSIGEEVRIPDDWGYDNSSTAPITGTTASTALVVPQAHTSLVISTFDGTNPGEEQVYDMVDGTQATYSLDVGNALLPWLAQPALDLTTGKITTAMVAGNGGGDAFDAYVEFSRPAASGSGSGSATAPTYYDWSVWAASVGDLTLPTLPTDLADNDPLPTDTQTYSSAYVFDLDLATGYDAVRPYLDSGQDAYYDGRGQLGKLRTSYSVNLSGRAPGRHSLRAGGRRQSRRVHVAHKTAAAR